MIPTTSRSEIRQGILSGVKGHQTDELVDLKNNYQQTPPPTHTAPHEAEAFVGRTVSTRTFWSHGRQPEASCFRF